VSAKIRIGAVSYLNTRPLVFGLEQGLAENRIELSYAVPARLTDRMIAGDLDIALMPVIELAKMPELEIVPGLAIGTSGPSRSVLLVSRQPIEDVKSIALDAESRTSNALVQVLCDRVWKIAPQFSAGHRGLDEALLECDAAVQIGDKALFADPPAGTVVYDLGGVWSAAMGMPFVFAAWFCRPGVIDREIYEALHESKRRGVKTIGPIAEDYTWRGQQYPQLSKDYLEKNIRFRLGSAELDAMRKFLSAAAEIGLIDQAPEPRLALTRWTSCHETAAQLKESRHANR
jgi:chorismate dehydratase